MRCSLSSLAKRWSKLKRAAESKSVASNSIESVLAEVESNCVMCPKEGVARTLANTRNNTRIFIAFESIPPWQVYPYRNHLHP